MFSYHSAHDPDASLQGTLRPPVKGHGAKKDISMLIDIKLLSRGVRRFTIPFP